MANESSNYGDAFGQFDRLPFPIGEKRAAADFPEIDKLAGMVVRGRQGFKARLVRLNIAAGLTAALAECRAFAYTLQTTGTSPETCDVELALLGGATPNKRVIGHSAPEQIVLVDNDLFWVVFGGPYVWGTLGDDAGTIAVGEYVGIDDDADKGKLKTHDTTFDPEYSIGIAIDAAAANDVQFRFKPLYDLVG